MNLVSVESISKSFSEKVLFEGISFGIEAGEKTALIARNGSGKTTLMRILAGLEKPDEGTVTYRRNLKIDYLEQEPVFDHSKTVAETIFNDTNPVIRLLRDYEAALDALNENPGPANEAELHRLSSLIDNEGAWDYENRIRQILSRLNIHNLHQPVRQLSGGQRKRIALARALIEPADLLLLDEPTNHLDVEMVEWLEDYLSRNRLSVLIVTHDRYFLDNVTTSIIELDRGKLFTYSGNYTYFLEKKAERELIEDKEKDKAGNLLRTELEWMRRMPKARGTKSKARIDAFYELKKKASGRKKEEKMELDVKMNRIGGKVIELKKVYKKFGSLTILKGFDYTFKTGERIGIVGSNGAGKTTFLNMLYGTEEPDSGKINVGDTIVFGYYSQEGLVLKEDKRVIEVVKEFGEMIRLADGTKVQASQFLQLFQFPPDMHYNYVSKLSGGERRRLHLLTVLIKNPNFLILDEPTNDLDLLTLGVLEEFLLHYKGCLLIVSHDRYFMDKLADHLFIFEGDGVIRDFNGTYSEYRMETEEREKAAKQVAPKADEKEKKAQADQGIKKKLSYKEKLEFDRLEDEISSLEEEKAKLTMELSSGIGDHVRAREMSERLQQIQEQVDEKTMRWLELSEMAS